MARKVTIVCLDCARLKPHHARSLCHSCYARALRAGVERNHTPPPRENFLPRDDLLHEVEFFLGWGAVSPEVMHERLGMSRDSFLQQIRRGVAAGDPRAVEFQRRAANPDRVAA